MPHNNSLPTTIFWSWQSDSPSPQNRSFIGDCIERAAKVVEKENATIFFVDRDTKGLGGTPDIANAILTKIRNSDLFIWDATLVFGDPKPSPNPNVLIEFGYALAALGTGRIIGIMNIENGRNGEHLPFDLAHRRWPIEYCLRSASGTPSQDERVEFQSKRNEARESLVKKLVTAMRESLKEQKKGLFYLDSDYIVAKQLWSKIDSKWLTDWVSFRESHPHLEKNEIVEKLDDYIFTVRRQEFLLKHPRLRHLHDAFSNALNSYTMTCARIMVSDGGAAYIISVKRQGYVENYDVIYERQVESIRDDLDQIRITWNLYVDCLRSLYPEIVYRLSPGSLVSPPVSGCT